MKLYRISGQLCMEWKLKVIRKDILSCRICTSIQVIVYEQVSVYSNKKKNLKKFEYNQLYAVKVFLSN